MQISQVFSATKTCPNHQASLENLHFQLVQNFSLAKLILFNSVFSHRPRKTVRTLVVPSNTRSTCLRGNLLQSKRQTTHCNGLHSFSSKHLMNPALLPVIDAVPSVPTTFRVSLNSVPLIASYTSFAMVIPLPSCGETCVCNKHQVPQQ